MRAPRATSLLADTYWALEPGKVEAVAELVENLVAGRETDNGPLARVAGQGADSRPYYVENGVAVISISDVIAFRLNLFQAISGGTSTEIIGKQVRMAARDEEVSAIVLDINSPGGAAHGLVDLASTIREAAAVKPVVAWTGELMCCAAYWVGSAATEIICSADARVGSIGVYYVHVESSGKDMQEGVKRTIFKAGRYKAAGNDAEPLSDDAVSAIQSNIDDIYTLFINTVAENLGMSVSDVQENMADGRAHIGEKALAKGFVHSIGDLAFALSRARALVSTINQEADSMPTGSTPQGGNGAQADSGSGAVDISAVSAEQIKTQNPALAAALVQEGIDAERARVTAIIEADANAETTLAAVKNGTEPEAFYRSALAAELQGRKTALADFKKSLDDSAGQSGKATTASSTSSDFMALLDEHVKSNEGCNRSQAMVAMARKHPEVHAAFLKAQRERS